MSFENVSRIKAATAHLLLSTLIAAAVAGLFLLVWYPAPLFEALGGELLLPMIVGVDVCLGPLLTLVVFSPGKARRLLLMDLSFIALMQLTALGYGIYAAFEGRPVFISYAQKYFVAVTANALDAAMLQDAADPAYRSVSWWGPTWVAAKIPSDPKEISDINFNQLVTGMSIHYQPKYFVDIGQVKTELSYNARPLEQLFQLHPESVSSIEQMAANNGLTAGNIGYLPLQARKQPMTVLIRKDSGTILGILDVSPGTETGVSPSSRAKPRIKG